jgi:DNA-binding MarR family transcriptional regulator
VNGFQKSVVETREEHERRILAQLEANRPVTQRSLSSDLGIALGLTNLLMRRLVKKGWVRITHVSPRRIRYLVTPAGIAAKARLTRQYFLSSVNFYRDCREHISGRFILLSAELEALDGDPAAADQIVFYGAGEVAEVAYVCLQETRLQLLGVVDESSGRRFFDHLVHPPEGLAGLTLAGRPFSMLVVMPSDDESQVRRILALRDVPEERVFWL